MNIIIGGGITGLILSKAIPNSVILELQPVIGGLYAFEDIANYSIPLVPPLVKNIDVFKDLFNIKYEIFKPIVIYEKEKYLKEKICKECDTLPSWLDFSSNMFWITNINDLLFELSRETKRIHEYPISIRDKRLVTNKGKIIEFEKLINTGSRAYINRLLNVKENISSKSLFLTILITSGDDQNSWNVYVNGHTGFNVSYIIRKELERNVYLNYIYAFFSHRLLDVKSIFNELKRLKILEKENILAFRSHVIKEAILFGKTEDNGIINCGRLGLWKNFTLEEAVDQVRKLRI